MKCERCGNETYVIYINSKYEKICDECYDKKERLEKIEKVRKYFTKDT